MTAFAMYGAIAVACWIVASAVVVWVSARILRALTSLRPVLTPECEDGPAAGDAAGPTNFHHP